MLLRENITTEEYKNSTQKDEYEYMYKKDDELKSDNITDKNKGVVEFGNDFMNCKFFYDRDSRHLYYSMFLKMLSLNSIIQRYIKC